MTDRYEHSPNDKAVYGAFLHQPRSAERDGTRVHESEHLQAVMEVAPAGAIIICAIAVGILVLGWLSAVLLFLARGPVG